MKKQPGFPSIAQGVLHLSRQVHGAEMEVTLNAITLKDQKTRKRYELHVDRYGRVRDFHPEGVYRKDGTK